VHGSNVLKTPTLWQYENSTAGTPTYLSVSHGGQEIVYAGRPADAVSLGVGTRKIEVYQANIGYPLEQEGVLTVVKPGQQWRFQVTVQGTLIKSYLMVGMEWFAVKEPKPGDANVNYISETDVFPGVTQVPEQVAVTSPPLPANVKAIALYVQLPEINPLSRIDLTVRNPSMVNVTR
jgi:hypothetical protein